jgi:hypothetical protein
VSPSALTTAITSTGVIEPVQTGQAAKDYLAKSVNPTLLKGTHSGFHDLFLKSIYQCHIAK